MAADKSPRARFWAMMLLVLAVAALIWAGLRLYNTAQDHDRPAADAEAAREG